MIMQIMRAIVRARRSTHFSAKSVLSSRCAKQTFRYVYVRRVTAMTQERLCGVFFTHFSCRKVGLAGTIDFAKKSTTSIAALILNLVDKTKECVGELFFLSPI